MIFETARLTVRAFTHDDALLFFRVNGNEEVMQHIRKALTRTESDKFLEENIQFYKQNPRLGRWCVMEKATNCFVGSFALVYLPFEDEKYKIQLGYALVPGAWGKGYATELTMAGINYYFANRVSNGGYVAFHDYADYYPGVKKLVDELLKTKNYLKINNVGSLVILQKK